MSTHPTTSRLCLSRHLFAAHTTLDLKCENSGRRVPEAFSIPSLKYDEAMELAYFGAQVLHPSAMVPCIDNGIPVYIRNIFNRDFKGTVISGRSATLQDADAAMRMHSSGTVVLFHVSVPLQAGASVSVCGRECVCVQVRPGECARVAPMYQSAACLARWTPHMLLTCCAHRRQVRGGAGLEGARDSHQGHHLH